MGLISAVVEPDELAREAERTAATIARAPRSSLVRTKGKAIRRLGIPAGTKTLEL